MAFEDLNHFGEVGKASCKSVNFVNNNYIDFVILNVLKDVSLPGDPYFHRSMRDRRINAIINTGKKPLRDRYPQPIPGTVLSRIYQEKEHKVTVTHDGQFEFEGVRVGEYRIEVTRNDKQVIKSDPFSVERGQSAPYFRIQLDPIHRVPFLGRTANPKNTDGNVVSPFSPESGRNLIE